MRSNPLKKKDDLAQHELNLSDGQVRQYIADLIDNEFSRFVARYKELGVMM